ncbi:MAG: N-acetyl-gamma-glutamyl-phosphate reductase [Rhodospirillales bacterium]|jgi:N-acetyl-gamma-glutamyl-phosphate reductase|nr:N-acetyl-gamma-glutamyl-phosphate reductase [Rhodospirillales bacterium]MBT4039975.1 N-acetyl-gamma-glutamyl-phosphate reductase [Rhodospirillales bacterium]MBT4628444.1 N-acetyl-gamma-glutamyl-phosphate reductase [Rhodospirillales bacterium]MBT5351692.1 N-acetyl-gamma-glutamyl-phosphate reductase [Rhodospirillales bacterium]MBT5519186.1 N-acetyl-gamma-glutamyl-phosphate reductase [Rhodospirillales bacterium]
MVAKAFNVFIDGEAGTTGLQISTRLEGRDDVELLRLADNERKDLNRRREMLNDADLVILCLPDDAAREAVSLIDNDTTRVIDASTAHRTADGWAYGMPEYKNDQNAIIAASTRVTNPGCYANASIAILHPLVEQGIVPADWPVTINAVSGYSGGGKGLINAFEDKSSPDFTDEAFRVYGLNLDHKHIPEIQRWSGLSQRPLFVPSVGRFRQGMIVQVPIQLGALPGAPSVAAVHDALSSHYAGRQFIRVGDTTGMVKIDPEMLNDTNELRLHVFGNDEHGQVVIMGVLDNLGKGASGQAVQNMNLMLGLPEETGLLAG